MTTFIIAENSEGHTYVNKGHTRLDTLLQWFSAGRLHTNNRSQTATYIKKINAKYYDK